MQVLYLYITTYLYVILLILPTYSLKPGSHLPKKYLLQWKLFKSDGNAFYFMLKASFVLKMFKFLCQLFGHIEKVGSLATRLISKFMMSQPGQWTITVHILPDILGSKGTQTMELVQLIEYNKKNFFFKNHTEIEARKLVPDLLFLKKKLYMR